MRRGYITTAALSLLVWMPNIGVFAETAIAEANTSNPYSKDIESTRNTNPYTTIKTPNPQSKVINNNVGYASANDPPVDGSVGHEGFYECAVNFMNGTSPRYADPNSSLNNSSYNLCFNGFAVKYSGISKTPLWSAEKLDVSRLRQASKIEREDSFHIEDRLRPEHQATLEDYRGSGFDRGHLSPNADMANKEQQHDSFSLANISPQNPKLNRGLWREVEYVTRGLVYDYGETYVVTGVTFGGEKVRQINKRVLVPSAQFKAIFAPSQNIVGAYYAPNDDSGTLEILSLDELKAKTGLDVMPSLNPDLKAVVSPLPIPESATLGLGQASSIDGAEASATAPTFDTSNTTQNNSTQPSHPNADKVSFIRRIILAIRRLFF